MDEHGLPLVWTKTEVALQLRVSERTVSRLISNGALPVVRIGSQIRIETQAVRHFLATSGAYNENCVELVPSSQGESTCNSINVGGSIKLPTSRTVENRLDALLKPKTSG
jgi:excisionase family DNA binding protein